MSGVRRCGKTTQLPQILMENASALMHERQSSNGNSDRGRSFGTGRIVCTQPRRISAVSVAERVCYERNERVGDRVGYQIRFEQKATDSTELLYCTTGILLRFLVRNPKLEGISCVVVDEVHERGVHTDMVLLILKDLVLERKGTDEPLKLVLMSATIDASNFLKYFDPESRVEFNNMSSTHGANDVGNLGSSVTAGGESSRSPFSVSFLQIEGLTNYPIEEFFIEDVCREIPSVVVRGPPPDRGRGGSTREQRNAWATPEAVRAKYSELGLSVNSRDKRIWSDLSNALQRPFELDVDMVCRVVEYIEMTESVEDGQLGSILIFVPGWAEITSVVKGLEQTLRDCRRHQDWARGRSWNILPLHSMVPQNGKKPCLL